MADGAIPSTDSNYVRVEFPFTPVPKGRARFTRRGFAYTPEKTRIFEKLIKEYARQFIKAPLSGPLSICVVFFMPKPKKPKNPMPISKPDLSNLIKSIEDALNGIAWFDDSQVVTSTCEKHYCESNQKPHILFAMWECKRY